MKELNIYAEDESELIEATREVLKLLEQGYTSGYSPDWHIVEVEQ